MKKNKRIIALLSTTAITALTLLGISTSVSAKASAIIVKDTNGKAYEYNYTDLKTSAVSAAIGDTTGAKLYEDFLSRKSSIQAYYDNVQKSYVNFSIVSKAATDSVIKGNTFDFNTFLETATTETLSPTKIIVDNNGNIVTNASQTTNTTLGIDMYSVQCSNPVDNYSTIVTFNLNIPTGDSAANYNVTVNGVKATYSAAKGSFAVTVDGKVVSADLKSSDFVVIKKDTNTTVTITKIDNINVNINQNDSYSLPSIVQAIMSDGTIQKVSVIWDKTVDTSQIGTFTFNGIVDGYSSKVMLTLNINENSINNAEAGNTSGNIVSGGNACLKDGWIYYSNDYPSDRKFYKTNIEGTKTIKINDDWAKYININNNYIYYKNDLNLCKMNIDGTHKIVLNSDNPYFINVVGDWIYYLKGYRGSIYKIKTDGTQKTKITDDNTDYIIVKDGWIYYSLGFKDDNFLHKIRIDGTGKTTINGITPYFNNIDISDGWIYYNNTSDNLYLYKARIDGTEKTNLNVDYPCWINVVNNWIYYSSTLNGFTMHKILIDGTNDIKLNNDVTSGINVVGDWIYYGLAKENSVEWPILTKIKNDSSESSNKTVTFSDENLEQAVRDTILP